jgi:hypothetical protein
MRRELLYLLEQPRELRIIRPIRSRASTVTLDGAIGTSLQKHSTEFRPSSHRSHVQRCEHAACGV